MLNWFRRQPKPDPSPEPETVQEVSIQPEESAQNKSHLEWAKVAFENIQRRKALEKQEQETQQLSEQQDLEELSALESENKKLDQEVNKTTLEPEEVKIPSFDGPAWLKRSDGLELLQESASDTSELDEEFVWSAKVLAESGRKAEEVSGEEIKWLKKLRLGLDKTRRNLVNQLKSAVGAGPLNKDAVLEIESLLLQADVGLEATDEIIKSLENRLKQEALPPEKAIEYLKEILRDILDRPLNSSNNQDFFPLKNQLNIWLMTGVNGAGKTTTVGKLAHLAQQSGYSCMIAAADTFRAAAVEQVKVWGTRSQTPVISNNSKNADPAAVVFDGIVAAQSRSIELLLVDTAGRLQNKKNLMEELAKIRRILDKKAPEAIVESLLVLDATLGQNGLMQAKVFSEAAQLSGVVLTKLDGTAKGGIALAIAQQLNLPIRFIGVGEGIEDLRPFSSYEFIEALLNG
jgi:fused signal recognition particle receptor